MFIVSWCPDALQKAAQISLDEHVALMDIVLVWRWLLPKLAAAVDSSMLVKVEEMFMAGFLGVDGYKMPNRAKQLDQRLILTKFNQQILDVPKPVRIYSTRKTRQVSGPPPPLANVMGFLENPS